MRPRPRAHRRGPHPGNELPGVALVAMRRRRAGRPARRDGWGCRTATGATQEWTGGTSGHSFPGLPSGHMRETAAHCVSTDGVLAGVLAFALAALAVVGFGRVLRAHYPTGVLGGAVVGLGGFVGGQGSTCCTALPSSSTAYLRGSSSLGLGLPGVLEVADNPSRSARALSRVAALVGVVPPRSGDWALPPAWPAPILVHLACFRVDEQV